MFFQEIFLFFERGFAFLQGKGFGTATIRQEINAIYKFLDRPPQLAIDIGANIGEYTAGLRQRSPDLEIHSFEPSSANVSKLRSRFGSDSKIKILDKAVAESSGKATLFSNESGSALGSLSKRNLEHFSLNFDITESIETLRFEDYWRDNLQSKPIDIVKLDVEGHEFSVLRGFGKALQVTKVIQFEFGGTSIDTRTYFQDFWYFFKNAGFDIYRITPFGVHKLSRYRETDEFFSMTNFIAVKK